MKNKKTLKQSEDSEAMSDEKGQRKTWIKVIRHPLTTAGTTILVGFLGVVITLYVTAKSRLLTFYQHPVKSVVVRKDQASALKVLHNDKEIKCDVTATQIAIWNKGNLSIRPQNFLKQVKLMTCPSIPILEAKIIKQSRDIIQLSLDKSHMSEGYIPLSWKILEKNDGGIVQIIYAGGKEVDIKIKGVIEGQKTIAAEKFSENIKSPYEQFESSGESYLSRIAIILLFLGLLAGTSHISIEIWRGKLQKLLGKKIVLTFLLVIVAIFVAAVTYLVYLYLALPSGPPFGF